MSDFKGIIKEKNLKNFAKALPSVLAQSDTRAVVRAASDGDVRKYTLAINKLSLKRIRDYNFVLVIFSPIVAAAQAVINYGDKNGDNLDEQHASLAFKVNAVLENSIFKKLCENIGAGNGSEIKKTLERFSDYKNLLNGISDNKYGKNDDLFMKRAAKITPWKINRKYINNKLIPFVKDSFGSRISSALRNSLPNFVAPTPSQSSHSKLPFAAPKAIPKVQMNLNTLLLPKNVFVVKNINDFIKLRQGLPEDVNEVQIALGVTEIPAFAFARCSMLKSVTIPSTVQKIGRSAFKDCSHLKHITIPEGTQEIGDYCFKGCQELETVNMPTSVKYIGKFAFNYCRALKEIVIPEGVEKIEWSTFDNCKSLVKVTIPKSVGEIGEYAFGGCPRNMQILGDPKPAVLEAIKKQVGQQ